MNQSSHGVGASAPQNPASGCTRRRRALEKNGLRVEMRSMGNYEGEEGREGGGGTGEGEEGFIGIL